MDELKDNNPVTAAGDYGFQVPKTGRYYVELTGTFGTGNFTILTPRGQAVTDHSGVTANQMKDVLLSGGYHTLRVTGSPTSVKVDILPV